MKVHYLTVLGSLGLAGLLSLYSAASSQQPPPDGGNAAQEGVEVMARGPVNEAFAEPSVRSPRPSPVIPKQPPDPIEEMPPDQKPEGANVTWIPGYWAWDDDHGDFIWVSGIWRDLPPDHQWVPGYWSQVEGGWQWVPGYWNVQAQQTVDYLPAPPDPITESVPPAPDAQSIYAPGCWMWHQTRYLWRPGFWIGFRPGWVWVPAHYIWTPAGYVFVDGYWDYPFADRGLLFAPVVIDPTYWARPRWYFRPSFVVWDTFLLGSLFVRLDHSSYYYGNYFDPRYSRSFIPWVDFRYGRTIPDPLFSYYRWHYAATNPRWDAEMRQLYVTRRRDPAARPPLTFAAASQAPAAGPAQAGSLAAIRTATPLVPLTRIASTGTKLTTVPQGQLTQIRQAASQTHTFAKERSQVEAKAFTQGQATAKAGQPLKVELPKTGRPTVTQPTPPTAKPKTPPPRPEHPKAEERRTPPRAEPTPGARPGTTQPPVTRPEPKPEPKSIPKGEPKVEPKREPKAEPKREPMVEPRPAPRVEPKPTPPAEPRPAPSRPSEPKPAPKDQKDKEKKDKDK
jgi:hypothetical protein